MSKSQHPGTILVEAKKKEKGYDWLEAAGLYEQALTMIKKRDFLKKGEIEEKIGLCSFRAAFQAESPEAFQQRMQRAIEAYEKAQRFRERMTSQQKVAEISRCRALINYMKYWITSDASKKRKLLDECLELMGEALTIFQESGEKLEYMNTYGELPLVFDRRCFIEWDQRAMKRLIERGVKWGEEAISVTSMIDNLSNAARAYLTLAICLDLKDTFLLRPEEREDNLLRTVRYLNKAVEASEKVGDAHILGLAHLWLGRNTGGEEETRHYEKAVECGRQTRDNFLLGGGRGYLASKTYWEALAAEDPEKRGELVEEAMRLFDKVQHHDRITSVMDARRGFLNTASGCADHYLALAEWETDLQKRQKSLKKAEKAVKDALKSAEDSGNPSLVAGVHHVVSRILIAQTILEADSAEKRSRLEEALRHVEKIIKIYEKLGRHNFWNLGVFQNNLAEIKVGLADIDPDLNGKRRLLEEAALSKQKGLELCNKAVTYLERMGETKVFVRLQGYQDGYAALLMRLSDITNNPEHSRKAIGILHKAIESASKVDIVNRMAESHWKIARVQDALGKYLEAAESFEDASEAYLGAAERIPQFKGLYESFASYMEAWREIEKAKHHHSRKQYGQAKEHYEKAAILHKSNSQLRYLSPNYLAWARLEEAEDLSRREQTEESRRSFQDAANLFAEAEKCIEEKLDRIETQEERQIAGELFEASEVRREYCLGRIDLEEAKALDRQGDHAASSEKYGLAYERFQKVTEAIKTEAGRKELRPIVYLSQAWHAMTRAEAEASPDLYLEASKLFDQAKAHSYDEKARILALGHSRFCKALEAGTRFEDTRNMKAYSTAKKHLEASANYYIRAGFKTASEYARATHRLLDAYMYMHRAETETEPRKKAQYYKMAEKLLQTSAGSYMKAKHPEKSEEVQRLLESVNEEQQLVVSLKEILDSPTATSTTSSFSTPTPTHERAVGLERFEHADVQANLLLRAREARVGEDLDLRMELVNTGKAPALLVKVDETVPEGFEIKEVPEIYTVEDSFIDMKGKRLNPLKTEDVKVVVTPQSKGTYVMKPRILYLDETGRYKSHEPEPVTITVTELGIKGWIKGER